MLHDSTMILSRVTVTLLLLASRLITCEATESKQAIICQKATLLLFYIPQDHQENFLQTANHLHSAGSLLGTPSMCQSGAEFVFIIGTVVQIKLSRFVIFAGAISYSMDKAIYHCQIHDLLKAPSTKRNSCFDRLSGGRHS